MRKKLRKSIAMLLSVLIILGTLFSSAVVTAFADTGDQETVSYIEACIDLLPDVVNRTNTDFVSAVKNEYDKLTAAQKALVSKSANDRMTAAVSQLNSVLSDPIRITCIGSSTCHGDGSTDWQKYSYPAQLGTLLGNNFVVGNFGASGTTIVDRETGYDVDTYVDNREYNDSLNSNPDMVLMFVGSNDLSDASWQNKPGYKDYFAECYEKMIHTYQNLTSHPIVVLCYPYSGFGGCADRERNFWEAKTVIDEMAEKYNLSILDLHTPTAFGDDWKSLMPDGLHPNDAGYVYVAEAAYDFVKSQYLAELSDLEVDGNSVDIISGIDEYGYITSTVPESITATPLNPDDTVEIVKPASIPGTATVTVTSSVDSTAVRTYKLKLGDESYMGVATALAKINAIGTVTASSKPAVLAARAAYDKLTAVEKIQVLNYDLLVNAETILPDLYPDASPEAQKVVAAINAIGYVGLNSRTAVEKARALYDALTDEQKAEIPLKYAVLVAAEEKLKTLYNPYPDSSKYTTYEAETSEYDGGLGKASDHIDYSGTGFSASFNKDGDGLHRTVVANQAGWYTLKIRYANGQGGARKLTVKSSADNTAKQVSFPKTSNWDIWEYVTTTIYLNVGNNTVYLYKANTDDGTFNVDCLYLSKAPMTTVDMTGLITNPGFENGTDGWSFISGGNKGADNGGTEGTKKLYFWDKVPNGVHQTITGLENGTYVVSVMASSHSKAEGDSCLTLDAFGDTNVSTTIVRALDGATADMMYHWYEAIVDVSNGELTIGATNNFSNPSEYLSFTLDDFRLSRIIDKTELSNLVNKAEISVEDYAPAAAAVISTAIADGKAVLENNDAKQGAVTSAGTALKSALADSSLSCKTYDPEHGNVNFSISSYANDETDPIQADHAGFMGNGYVAFPSGVENDFGFTAKNVVAAEDGYYEVKVRFANGNSTAKTLSIYSNDNAATQLSFPGGGTWGSNGIGEYDYITTKLALKAGANTITLCKKAGDSSELNIDLIKVANTPSEPIAEADYTAVDAAVASTADLVEAEYTEDSWTALQNALNAVVRGLLADKQTQVDGYATAINEAVKSLVKAVKLGDLDGDGNVTVSDVVRLRTVIISGNPTANEITAGDINKDGNLTVSDVVELRKMIMQG